MVSEAHKKAVRARRQKAVKAYMPERVSLLLVAEAPPAADNRYFYFADVTSHDWLFRGVKEGLFGEPSTRWDKAKGLTMLRDSGVFLIDLKLNPVNGSNLNLFVPDLVARCRELNPERIILIKATVFDVAYQPLRDSGLPVVNKRVYFPSTGRQREFQKQFKEAINMEL